MKKLKLTGRIYVGYTGQIGRYDFVDGVSVEEIPLNERLRISANFDVVEVEEDGADGENPSPALLVINNKTTPAEIVSLERQTDAEKTDENVQAVMGSEKPRTLLSKEALEAVIASSGIAGLREIANEWGVKHKSIPVLLQMVIDAQDHYIVQQGRVLAEKGIPVEEIANLLKLVTPVVEAPAPKMVKAKVAEAPAPVAEKAVNTAAATGDLAAALNQSGDKPTIAEETTPVKAAEDSPAGVSDAEKVIAETSKPEEASV